MPTCLRYEDVYGLAVAANTPAWNGSAISVSQLEGDGYYSVQISSQAVGIVVGLVRTVAFTGYSHIEHGLYFTRGTVQVMERGQLVGAPTTFTADAIFHIVRRNHTVLYCKSSTLGGPYAPLPGDVFRTSARLSPGTVSLGASLYSVNDTILSMNVSSLNMGGAAGTFALEGLGGTTAGTYARGYLAIQGAASGQRASRSDGRFGLSGLAAVAGYNEARGQLPPLSGSAFSYTAPEISSAEGTFRMSGESSASEYIPCGANGTFRIAVKASAKANALESSSARCTFGLRGRSTGRRTTPVRSSGSGRFSVRGIVRGTADSWTYANAAGVFGLRGSALETLDNPSELNTGFGFFAVYGSSNAIEDKWLYADVSGNFSLSGNAFSDTVTLVPSSCFGSFALGGVTSSAWETLYGSSWGVFGLRGSSSGRDSVVPSFSSAFGTFALSGYANTRDNTLAYADAAGQLGLFGYSAGRRSDVANYFDITLRLSDDWPLPGEPDALARFAPVKVFPGYQQTYSAFSIPLVDLEELTADDAQNHWPRVALSLLRTIEQAYLALPATEQPVNARPWLLESAISQPVDGQDMTTLRTQQADVTCTFVTQYGTTTLLEDN